MILTVTDHTVPVMSVRNLGNLGTPKQGDSSTQVKGVTGEGSGPLD